MSENNGDIFKLVRSSIASGMTREEFDAKKHLIVAPGFTVHDYVEMSLDFGAVEWRENKLVYRSEDENDKKTFHQGSNLGQHRTPSVGSNAT